MTSHRQMAAPASHRPCAHAGTESGRSPNPLLYFQIKHSMRKEKFIGKITNRNHNNSRHSRRKINDARQDVRSRRTIYAGFILKMCMNGKVIVNSDLRELNQELRYQGNNLNQLTKLCHQGRIYAPELTELLMLYRQILVALRGENDGGY